MNDDCYGWTSQGYVTLHPHFEHRCVVAEADPDFLDRALAYLRGGPEAYRAERRRQRSPRDAKPGYGTDMSEPDLNTPEGLLKARIEHRIEVLLRAIAGPADKRSVREAQRLIESVIADIYEHSLMTFQHQFRAMLGMETAAPAPVPFTPPRAPEATRPADTTASTAPPMQFYRDVDGRRHHYPAHVEVPAHLIPERDYVAGRLWNLLRSVQTAGTDVEFTHRAADVQQYVHDTVKHRVNAAIEEATRVYPEEQANQPAHVVLSYLRESLLADLRKEAENRHA